MRDLTVTLVQTHLHWEDCAANLAHFETLLTGIENGTDLIVLPEMFTTGFTMNAADSSQTMSSPAVGWLQEMAAEKGCDLTGSMIIEEGGNYYNRLLWARPDGQLYHYDKRHLFRMAGEHEIYSAGERHLTVNLNGWNIRPFICYDLRFPAWLRNLDNAYDVAIFIANWPRPRARHWKILLQARAVENFCYVVGVNRIGSDGNGRNYSGDSAAISPEGKVLFQVRDKACTQSLTLSREELSAYRKAFPAWMDADRLQTIRGT